MNQLPTIATLGGHSALEICLGAKKFNFPTFAIVRIGRDKTYTKHFRNLVDEYITVESFKELTEDKVIKNLQEKRAIFVPHRYCQVYCNLGYLEKKFPVPVFGNKYILKYEERIGPFNQYQLLYDAQVEYPRQYKRADDIDRLVIVKVKEAARGYERAFFFARNLSEFKKKADKFIKEGRIRETDLKDAVIEEYLLGPQVNFNFFYSSLTDKLELLGTDLRRQTNIDGLTRLPADQQQEILSYVNPSYIEIGHVAVTVKESLLEKAFNLAERLVEAAKTYIPPGIIGPFALQTAIVAGPPAEKIIIYDLSLRIPGSPGIGFTPYSHYLYGKSVSFGERIAMEIKLALETQSLAKITT